MPDGAISQNQRVAYRTIEGAAVLIAPEDSRLYWLNDVATRIWELCEGGTTLDALAEAICAEFEVDRETARRDAAQMIEAFLAKGLLVPSGRTV